MTTLEMKHQITTMLDSLPETKLSVLYDFLQYLVERETATDLLWMQMQSDAYQEWVSEENDVYDQVFADV